MQFIERPFTLLEEDPQCRRQSPVARVEKMFEQILAKLPGEPQFILCVLPERKNCDIYGMALLLIMDNQTTPQFDHVISLCSYTFYRTLEEKKSQ